MPLIRQSTPAAIQLKKDLLRSIKRGHVWLFSDAVESPTIASGSTVRIHDRRGEPVACGIYCRNHPITVRVCRTDRPLVLDDHWLMERLKTAIHLRQSFIDDSTNGYRLVAGEGDFVPGLIVDRYDRTLVIKLDGGAPEQFYMVDEIGQWLAQQLGAERVIHRPRGRGTVGEAIVGELPSAPIPFLENGLKFTADVVRGQKTGFFLDQRDNRQIVKSFARDRHVLNLFSFSGGFSIAAGSGGAASVTSVDIAAPAIQAAQMHWRDNSLPEHCHEAVVADCFQYLENARAKQEQWELVICDPPSFAPSQQTQAAAINAYTRLAQHAANVVTSGGLLALASCSSHINSLAFTQANLEGIGRAKRVAKLIVDRGLPPDHPTPFAMQELRYLKFQMFQLS